MSSYVPNDKKSENEIINLEYKEVVVSWYVIKNPPEYLHFLDVEHFLTSAFPEVEFEYHSTI